MHIAADIARTAAEQANRLFGQWMPERWLNLFIDSYNDILECRDAALNPGADSKAEQEAAASPAKTPNREFDSPDRGLIHTSAQAERWRCGARQRNIGPEVQDCDWPVCGCDPYASKVLDAIQESGFKIEKAIP